LGPIDRASPKRCVFKNKQDGFLDTDMTMDNVQKHNICTNVPSSQTFRSYSSTSVSKANLPYNLRQNDANSENLLTSTIRK
jgi:hypothetical protein